MLPVRREIVMNKTKAILRAVAVGIFILLIVAVIINLNISPKTTSVVTRSVEIETGACEEINFEIPFSIKRSGQYRCKIGFWPKEDPGFLTGFYINDKDGNAIWGATAQKLTMDSDVHFLEKGDYKVVFEIIKDNEQFRKFYDDHKLTDYAFSEWDGFKDSNIDMTYEFSITRSVKDILPLVALLCGALGIVLAAIFSMSMISGEKVKFEYDERMLLSRYKSEERALFVIVAGMVIIFLLSAVEAEYAFGVGLQVFSVLILGITVAAIDSILHDGFFAMNYNKKGYIIGEIIICLICLIAAIISILNSMLFVNERITILAVFPIISLMQIAIFTALLIKRQKDKAED